MIEPGDKLPAFNLQDQGGDEKSFKDITGPKGLVIFVYSKDHTSGCTAEAAEFHERAGKFARLGFGLAGLSRDTAASHAKFADKLGLGYPLLADPESGLLKALGAWGQKKLYGKVSEGPVRSTVVADQKGKVIKAYPKVKAKGHAQQVLEDLS